MLVLGVETSCDDTAAAVLQDGRAILANIISSQDQVHSLYGGVVPELASRQHIKNVMPIVDGALRQAGVTLKDVDGMAVTYGPGLVGSLLVGLSFVKGISFRSGIPYVGVNHLEAHLLAIHLEHDVPFPYIALLASGGHTLLYCVNGVGDYVHLGGTRDDAAGEAYDKVAKMMGLGYPGGRAIDQLAQAGNPRARFAFRGRRLRAALTNSALAGSRRQCGIILKSPFRSTVARTNGGYRGEFSGGDRRDAGSADDQSGERERSRANRAFRRRRREQPPALEDERGCGCGGIVGLLSRAEILHGQRRDDRPRRLSLAEARPARRFSPQCRRRSDSLNTVQSSRVQMFKGSA